MTSSASQHSIRVAPMISCEDLKALIDTNGDIVILDCSIDKSKKINYEEEFKTKGHIEGAHYFYFRHGTTASDLYPNPLMDASQFETYARSFGINSNSTVIIYEAMPKAELLSIAGRVWFLFRYFGHNNVRVLDGGLEKWTSLGYPTIQGETPKPAIAGNLVANEQGRALRVLYEDVLADVTEGQGPKLHAALVDARPKSVFDNGHLPNAVNIPYNIFNDQTTGTLLPKQDIVEVIRQLGLDPPQQAVVVNCQTGMTACGLALIAAHAGLWNWRVYLGSWNEWSKRRQ